MNESKDTELRQVARLRLARMLTDQGKSDDAIKMLSEPMSSAFATPYHEAAAMHTWPRRMSPPQSPNTRQRSRTLKRPASIPHCCN